MAVDIVEWIGQS